MGLRSAFYAIVVLAIAAGAAAIAFAEGGLEHPAWQGHGIKAPGKEFPLQDIVSGYWFRTKETRTIQDDDFQQSGILRR